MKLLFIRKELCNFALDFGKNSNFLGLDFGENSDVLGLDFGNCRLAHGILQKENRCRFTGLEPV